MENLALLIKLTIIFIGSGLSCLIAFWVINEMRNLAKLIVFSESKPKFDKELLIVKSKNLGSNVGFYEARLSSGKSIKIFSSDNGMRIF